MNQPKPLPGRRFTRRTVLAASALAIPTFLPSRVFGANERLNVAGIGAGGKGAVDIDGCSRENIVAMADVDHARAATSFKRFAKASRYFDFRQMLDEEGQHIDAVIVSTPDHTHAVAAAMALRMGKHVYCQKPLTHKITEARLLTQLARKHKVATQMGNQGHSNPDSRRLVELIRGGALGEVKEAHVWTDRPIWPQGVNRPRDTPQPPKTLDWDLWLGPAPERPYHPAYVPFKWRGWWDFGTGALGDMGCHNQDLAYWALNLRDPETVEAIKHSGVNGETAPKWSIIQYQFPKNAERGPVKLTWYDGGKKPDPALARQKALPGNGSIIVGTKDTLYVPMYWGPGQFLSGAKMSDFKEIDEFLPKPRDFGRHHYLEWIEACKGGPAAHSNFDYAGPMTESVLLANVALRAGSKLQWDTANLRVTNNKAANQYVRHHYRNGWRL
ncbi:MAG: oxidoreductase [Verrucomicrobiales bacterium]|nr:oxidoreductase [Verrucomicrobiales bacterium]|tara:strand:- start:317 stop:1642 length:1326 start_codon:yes stop_codon:yes gene_type:complete